MHKTRVIPVVLLTGYNVVKSIGFSTFRTIGNPITVCRVYESRGVDELILLDIRATPECRQPNLEIISDISSECFMPLTVGGGVRSLGDAQSLLRYGADKICINTSAVEHPDFIRCLADEFGSQCVVVSIDAKLMADKTYRVVTHSGRQSTAIDVRAWAEQVEKLGAGEILLNSVERDGALSGYDVDLIKQVTSCISIPVIACGGAGVPEHFAPAIQNAGANAVAAASIFSFTKYTPRDVKEHMQQKGIPVRIHT